MVASNPILYKPGEHPDHVVVIKYVPYVADSKRAMDEYTSEIFMGGRNTIVMHNTCEDRCAQDEGQRRVAGMCMNGATVQHTLRRGRVSRRLCCTSAIVGVGTFLCA